MESTPEQNEAKRQELARSLGCITSGEFCTLAGITQKTEESWRHRGKAPQYIRLGRTYLYPRDAVTEFLRGRIHRPTRVPAKELL